MGCKCTTSGEAYQGAAPKAEATEEDFSWAKGDLNTLQLKLLETVNHQELQVAREGVETVVERVEDVECQVANFVKNLLRAGKDKVNTRRGNESKAWTESLIYTMVLYGNKHMRGLAPQTVPRARAEGDRALQRSASARRDSPLDDSPRNGGRLKYRKPLVHKNG